VTTRVNSLISPELIASSLRIATPLILASLGCLICQRAGVFNIALEGMMLVGAFFGVVGAQLSGGSVETGMLFAVAGGLATGFIFGIATIWLKANHIVASIAINFFGLGITSFLLRAVFDIQGAMRVDDIEKLNLIHVPGVSNVIGDQSAITYASIALCLFTIWFFKKTHLGIAVHSVGESPEIALTAGINNDRIKMGSILVSGALCGLAGAFLSTVVMSAFTENMVAGRGFTAFTATAFGNGNPLVTLCASLLLGFADAFGIRLEIMGTGISPQIVAMTPYLLALFIYTLSMALRKARSK
jgi:simple sugar transport system permease protein